MASLFGDMSPALVLAMILGLVQLLKKFNVSGNWLIAASVGIGFLFGGLFELGEIYPAIMPWIRVVFYGVLMGLAASGLYDFAKVTAGRLSGSSPE